MQNLIGIYARVIALSVRALLGYLYARYATIITRAT